MIQTALCTLRWYLRLTVENGLTALGVGAPRYVAFDFVRIIHWPKSARAFNARANHGAALELVALQPIATDVRGVVDQSKTVGALDGVARWF